MFKRGAAHSTARSPAVSRIALRGNGEERTARSVEGVARRRLAVGRGDVRGGGERWRPPGASVVARERLPVELQDVLGGGIRRASRGAAVGARERLPVGRVHVLLRRTTGTSRCLSGRPRTAARGTFRLGIGRRCKDIASRYLTRSKRTTHNEQ